MRPGLRLLAVAARQPDAVALELPDGPVTYRTFARLVERLAARIRDVHLERRSSGSYPHGDGPCVLILAGKDVMAYAARFAADLAGGFYTPLLPDAPPAKQAAVVEQLQPTVAVVDGAGAEVAAGLSADMPILTYRDLPRCVLASPVAAHDLAYVMFTSGSTGAPKGVMVPAGALSAYCAWVDGAMAPGPGDRVAQHPALSFDISATDIYGALCNGATLCPLTAEADRVLPGEAIRRIKPTIWNSVPSVMTLMLQAGHVTPEHLGSVRLFNFCGEPLPPEPVRALWQACPDAIVQNTYGPTEATVACTARRLRADTADRTLRATAALGAPLLFMGLHLVGGDGPDRGEIVLTGPQLARGYWQDPERTAAVFRPVTVEGASVPGYHTGDIAERVDGELFFVARKDRQVKIAGHRIELEEVAAAIRACGHLACAVTLVGDSLTAFVEAETPPADGARGLQQALRRHLDPVAVPRRIEFRPRLARNQNDKIDVNAMAADLSAA